MLSLLLVLALSAQPDGIRIEAGADAGRVRIVAPIQNAAADVDLTLGLVDEATGTAASSVFGTLERSADQLIFTPRYRLVAGNTYRAQLRLPGGKLIAMDYRVPPPPETPAPVVERIYPTSNQLPANLLKFYLHFSRPMREGSQIFDQIHLLDAAGKPIEGPWRLTELWNDDAQRLTLYVHPGRIKTGVKLREDEGPVLVPGRQYTLIVTRDVRDNIGKGLADAFRKTFTTTPEVHAQLDLSTAKLNVPKAGTRDPLSLTFPRPLDRYLFARCIKVVESDQALAGVVSITDEERTLQFVPESSWQDTAYELEFDPILEDLAGNSPVRIFDTDLNATAPVAQSLTREFRPR